MQQTITFTGPDEQLAALRKAAVGSGFVPRHTNYERLEGDCIYRLRGRRRRENFTASARLEVTID